MHYFCLCLGSKWQEVSSKSPCAFTVWHQRQVSIHHTGSCLYSLKYTVHESKQIGFHNHKCLSVFNSSEEKWNEGKRQREECITLYVMPCHDQVSLFNTAIIQNCDVTMIPVSKHLCVGQSECTFLFTLALKCPPPILTSLPWLTDHI